MQPENSFKKSAISTTNLHEQTILVAMKSLLTLLFGCALGLSLSANNALSAYSEVAESCLELAGTSSTYTSSIPDVLPWGGKEKDGSSFGLIHDFFSALSARSAIESRVAVEPYARLLHSVRSGRSDFSMLYENNYEGLRKVTNLIEVKIIMISKGRDKVAASLREFSGQRVGYIRQTYYGQEFESADYLNKITMNNLNQGLVMLLHDRLDLLASTDRTLYQAMEELNISTEEVSLRYIVHNRPTALYISEKSPNTTLLPCIIDSIALMKKDGQLEGIFSYRNSITQTWFP